jgi:hypothetical protein
MALPLITTASVANRRRTRRCALSGHAKTECRKGIMGLGGNVAVTTLDISETGARLIVQIPFAPGTEVELQFMGAGLAKALKRTAKVVWSLLLPDNCHAVGLLFDKHLSHAELQRLARI